MNFDDFLKANLTDDQMDLFDFGITDKRVNKKADKPKTESNKKPVFDFSPETKKASKPTVTQSKPKAEKPKTLAEIVKFPEPDTPKEKVVTSGNATYEDCVNKMQKEREVFKESDSQYVINGILELCKVDADFRNNFMRKEKTYLGALKYFAQKAREGHAIMVDGIGAYMDCDIALAYALEYFNMA